MAQADAKNARNKPKLNPQTKLLTSFDKAAVMAKKRGP
jgi:hypothetical protein